MIDSLKKTLHDRMTSPFTGSFLVSWVIVNWKFVLALVAGGKYAEKIAVYDKLYPSFWPVSFWPMDCNSGVFYFILYPLLGACFYISLYQLIIAGTLRVWFTVERAKAWGRRNKILTVEESQKIIIENGELINENDALKSSSVEIKEENKRYKHDVDIFEKVSGIKITESLAGQTVKKARADAKNLEEVVMATKKSLEDKENELHEAIKETERLSECEEILSNEVASLRDELKGLKQENVALKKFASTEDMKVLGLAKNSKKKIKIDFDLSEDERELLEKIREKKICLPVVSAQKVVDFLLEEEKAWDKMRAEENINDGHGCVDNRGVWG